MASITTLSIDTLTLSIAVGTVAVLGSLFVYLFSKPPFPENAPALTSEAWPVLGSLQFFTERWSFFERARAHSHTGNFSFYAGQWPVVAISGEESRKVFFEHRGLGFAEAYAALLGGQPKSPKDDGNALLGELRNDEGDFSAYFNKRLINMVKGNQLKKNLPLLLADARSALDSLGSSGSTDPFDSIYRMVFQFTMRTVACNDIANDHALLERTLKLYEAIEGTGTPLSIMFPWMPVPAKVKRTYAGAQLYMIFKRVVDGRNQSGIKEDDALQYLMDQGDSVTDIITFVLGALFAGQLNSGINAAWILVYLASKPYWLDRVREEVVSVADRYCPDDSVPLKERLMRVPVEAWEGEFPIIDICLKDSIRLQMSGAAFRKNVSGQDIPLNKHGEVIPKGAYATFAAGDIHYNPEIYSNPDEWDPARYLPERAEDKKQQHACKSGVPSLPTYPQTSTDMRMPRDWLGHRTASMPRHALCQAREQPDSRFLSRLLRRD